MMEKLNQLEDFYVKKFNKEELAEALENVDNKPLFEITLKESLSLRDFVFTFLSYGTSKEEYQILWNSINKDFKKDSKFVLKTSNDVIKDKFFCKNDLLLHYKLFLNDSKKNC